MTAIKIKDFRMSCTDYKELDCKTPCSMYSVLYGHGLIEDPFFSDNWRRLSALSEDSVSFTADFDVPLGMLGMHNLSLRLCGIDTVAYIELNGMPVSRTDNMNECYLFDVKHIIHAGKNTLTLYFESAISEMRSRRHKSRPGREDGAPNERSYLRKAEFMTDGVFSPVLADMGILGEVELVGYNHKVIDFVRVKESFEGDFVRFDLELDTVGSGEGVRALATLVSPGGSVFYCGFVDGKGTVTVKDPNLWWPNGLGVQSLYKLSVSLYYDGVIEDTREYRIGVRDLRLDKENNCFLIGKDRIFPMGEELVPLDSLIARVAPDRERELIKRAQRANLNIVKMSSGIYPSDALLDALDECGILLWLDITPPAPEMLMVADTRESIRRELLYNFARMSTHPSLALITSLEAPALTAEMYGEFKKLLEEVAGATLRGCELLLVDGDEAEKGEMLDLNDGISTLAYINEAPYLSLPDARQLSAFARREDMNLFSPTMEAHSEGKKGNLKLIDELYSSYPYPSGLSEVIYTTQLAAAESARLIVEEKRRDRDNIGMAFFSRLNDTWPAISPSSIDYRQCPKALYYKSAGFLSNLAVSAVLDGTRVKFYISNERRNSFDGALSYSLVDNGFKAIRSGGTRVSCEPFCSCMALEVNFAEYICGMERQICLVYEISEGATTASKGTLLFTKPKNFDFKIPKIDWQIAGTGNDFTVTVSSDCLSLGVQLGFTDTDAYFEDNFFDITSSAPLRIGFHVEDGTAAEILRKQFFVRSLNEIGKSF